jgi:3-mercaptopyruvate sulfurtransferase SseA
MKTLLSAICLLSMSAIAASAADRPIPNRLIDYPQFLKGAEAVNHLRKERRVTEDDFIKMAADQGTIVLDARSSEKYRLLHVKGAKHLSLPDITEEELARIIPTKQTRVLIYCNNNFENAPAAFPGKCATASLNIYTFNSLHSYGYTNVYELGPLLDIRTTKIPLEGTGAKERH